MPSILASSVRGRPHCAFADGTARSGSRARRGAAARPGTRPSLPPSCARARTPTKPVLLVAAARPPAASLGRPAAGPSRQRAAPATTSPSCRPELAVVAVLGPTAAQAQAAYDDAVARLQAADRRPAPPPRRSWPRLAARDAALTDHHRHRDVRPARRRPTALVAGPGADAAGGGEHATSCRPTRTTSAGSSTPTPPWHRHGADLQRQRPGGPVPPGVRAPPTRSSGPADALDDAQRRAHRRARPRSVEVTAAREQAVADEAALTAELGGSRRRARPGPRHLHGARAPTSPSSPSTPTGGPPPASRSAASSGGRWPASAGSRAATAPTAAPSCSPTAT